MSLQHLNQMILKLKVKVEKLEVEVDALKKKVGMVFPKTEGNKLKGGSK